MRKYWTKNINFIKIFREMYDYLYKLLFLSKFIPNNKIHESRTGNFRSNSGFR
jgi:hypothetical protein